MIFFNRDDVIMLTPKWTGERFDDGRPRVPDEILKRISVNTITELWRVLYVNGYKYQFERSLKVTHPGRILIGRAVTADFMPTRPDLHQHLLNYGHTVENRKGNFNQWALDQLVKDDVVVFDMKGKIYEGCPWGGNLTSTIKRKTGQGGIVYGGLRDIEQIEGLTDVQFYYLDNDPTPFMDTMLLGINVPVKIGGAVCLPGDVVLGTSSGLLFIPPHLAEPAVVDAEKSHIRDIWGFIRIDEGKYTAAHVDSPWGAEMWEDFTGWFASDKQAEPYKHLNFDQELDDARKGFYRSFFGDIIKFKGSTTEGEAPQGALSDPNKLATRD